MLPPPGALLQPDPSTEQPTPAPQPPVAQLTPASPLAGLRDLLAGGLLLVGYLWLCCGGVLLAALAVGAVILLRRRP